MIQVKPHDPQTLIWWYGQREKIDMTPKYQRRSNLWSSIKQAYLIDSILNDYDMPKFYLADFNYVNTPLNKRRKPYAVIDGKQRLQAIFKFFDGQLRLKRNFVYESDQSLDLRGLNYPDLKKRYPNVAEKAEKHIPTVMSVISDKKGAIEELFMRLNTGVHVSGAERRNAMQGIVPIIIRRLVKHKFFTSNIRFDTKRMADHNTAAKLLLIEHGEKFTDTFAKDLDALVERGTKRTEANSFKEAEGRVGKGLNQMSTVFKEKDSLLSSTGPIPVYYWFVKHNAANKKYIRDFLNEFVKSVQENQRTVQVDPDAGDPELSHYYTMQRTTNEGRSLTARYEILEKRFTEFLQEKK